VEEQLSIHLLGEDIRDNLCFDAYVRIFSKAVIVPNTCNGHGFEL
jgi:hypothetical protein